MLQGRLGTGFLSEIEDIYQYPNLDWKPDSYRMYKLTYSCTCVMCFSCFSYFFISDGASVTFFSMIQPCWTLSVDRSFYVLMGNDLTARRASIGLFQGRFYFCYKKLHHIRLNIITDLLYIKDRMKRTAKASGKSTDW